MFGNFNDNILNESIFWNYLRATKNVHDCGAAVLGLAKSIYYIVNHRHSK